MEAPISTLVVEQYPPDPIELKKDLSIIKSPGRILGSSDHNRYLIYYVVIIVLIIIIIVVARVAKWKPFKSSYSPPNTILFVTG